ncbi:trigger factor [Lawsonella sp.]|uniref:trigger factor n=1 Tax=Lawsonella sp. TaxID=2041415 RepID=UPI0025B95240|nr:trigger factor [Lawsonella sp.]
MKSTVEKLSPTRVKLVIEVPFDELKEEFDKAYKTIAEQVNIPGFRKGHAPAKLIENHVGRGAVLEQVINDMMPSRYEKACTENDVQPLSTPDVDVTKIDDPNLIEFTAEMDCRPEIKIPDFKGKEISVEPRRATDEIAEQGLKDLQERFATLKGVDRPAKEGDFVSLDLSAKVNGEELKEAETKGLSHRIGQGDLIEGLEDALVGMKAGESKTFTSKLVAGDHANEEADITVVLQKVQEQELPELDDDFAQMASEFDTLDELKEDLAKRANDAAKSEQAANLRDAVLSALIEEANFDIPKGIVEEQAQGQIQQVLSQFGGDENILKSILESQGSDLDSFYDEAKNSAEEATRTWLLLDALAEELSVEISQNDLTEAVVAQARQNNMEPEQFVQAVQQQGQLASLFSDVRRNKALFTVVRDVVAKDTEGNSLDDLMVFFQELPDMPEEESADAE